MQRIGRAVHAVARPFVQAPAGQLLHFDIGGKNVEPRIPLALFRETPLIIQHRFRHQTPPSHFAQAVLFFHKKCQFRQMNKQQRIQHKIFHFVGTFFFQKRIAVHSGEEALHRLKYYFFVNHLSHVVQRLAYYSGQVEHLFWAVVRQTLATLAEDRTDTRLRAVAHDLLVSPTLPAKANLLSRFHQRGETPLYVDIPNPIIPKKT